MSNQRQKELDALQREINNIAGDDNDDFDEVAEMKKLKERQRAEEQLIKQQNAEAAMLARQFGVNGNEGNTGKSSSQQQQQRSTNSNQQRSQQQAPQMQQQQRQGGKQGNSDDISAMIQNMKGGGDDEVIIDDGYKQRQAELNRDMKEMEKASKQFQNFLPGNDVEQIEIPDTFGGPQMSSAQKQQKQNEMIDNTIQQDQVYSKSTDMNCVTVLAQEYKLCDEHLQNKSITKLVNYFTQKKEDLKKNVNTLNNLYLQGRILPQKYIEIIEKSLTVQEELRSHVKETKNTRYSNRILLRIGQMKKDILQLKQSPIASMEAQFQEAIEMVEGVKKNQNNSMSNSQMLNLIHDDLSLLEKIKLMSKNHKQFHNLTIYFKQNIPEKENAVKNYFSPILMSSKEILDKLKEGQNLPISSFLNDKLQEVTPEFFHGLKQSQFEAQRLMWVERLEQTIKQEYDIQKMAVGQKRAMKGNDINEQSVLRMNEYVYARDELKRLTFTQYIPFPKIEDYKVPLNFNLDNKSINKNTIIITIKRLVECKAGKYQVNYAFTPTSKPISHQTDWCNPSLVFNNEYKIDLEINQLPRDLPKKKIDIILYEKGFFSNSEYARGSISLQELETNNSIDSSLLLTHKGHNFSLDYSVQIRSPIESANLKEAQAFKFKFYQQFKLNEGVADYVQKNVSESKVNPSSQAQQPKPQPQEQPQKPQQQPQQIQQEEQPGQIEQGSLASNPLMGKFFLRESTSQEVQEIRGFSAFPPGLTAGDLLDLENPIKFQSLPYLKLGYDAIDAIIKENNYSSTNRRAASKIRDKFLELSTIFEMKFSNGNITAEEYQNNLKEMLDLNVKVIWVFKQMRLESWEAFARARHEIIMKDFSENFEEQYEGAPYKG